MSSCITQQATALIDHIQSRFHEGHRCALPQLRAQAAVVETRGIADGLCDELCAIAGALERHMFKEEMRLFPMMEQGGNTLIGHLIDDLQREHVEHQDAMNRFRARLSDLAVSHGAEPALQQFIQGVDALAQELSAHMHAEDEDLFPRFAMPAATRAPAGGHTPPCDAGESAALDKSPSRDTVDRRGP